jgi:DNA-binding NarL/FixJ family response regulator
MTANKINILIADDHPILLQGLIRIIKSEFENAEIVEANSGNGILEKARKQNFDLIISDIGMPDRNGIEVLKQLRSENVQIPMLFLSMYPEEQYAVRAIKAGAIGYLTKSSAPDELVNAIKTVLSGKKYITPTLAEALADALFNKESNVLHDLLSDREFEVMKLIASGMTIKQMADSLSLSSPTISTYRARLLDKMGMKTNAELTHYVIKNGLLQP